MEVNDLLPTGIVLVVWIILLHFHSRIKDRWIRRLDHENEQFRTRIRHYEKHQYLRDFGYDLDECEDCHLPGDCPLCGAR